MHITLSFLGNVSDSEQEQAARTVNSITHQPAPSTIDRIGYFPGEDYIQVVWAGVSSPDNTLHTLADKIRTNLTSICEDKHAFTPHITLSRVDSITTDEREQLVEQASQLPSENLQFTADTITLFESRPTNGSHQHIPLTTNELA